MLIASVVGARPNFMKIAPIVDALSGLDVRQLLVHTGQHYDANLSRVFFEELQIPEPDVYLRVGSGSHAQQTARVMIAVEKLFGDRRPDLVLVAGDVNSTAATALVAAKQCIPLAHVEAGLRSFDRTMPEEVNRVVTDHLSDLLFVTEESGERNLAREGIDGDRVHLVGNCMVDSLLAHLERAIAGAPWRRFDLEPEEYGLLTLHRPSNVDDPAVLGRLVDVLSEISQRLPLIFPLHPRTRVRLREQRLELPSSIRRCEPLPYLAFLGLMARSRCVLTDSGGIQEETTTLDIPCLTLRSNTERPITIERGSNRLVGTDPDVIRGSFEAILAGDGPRAERPPLWDGRASRRIAAVIGDWAQSAAGAAGAAAGAASR